MNTHPAHPVIYQVLAQKTNQKKESSQAPSNNNILKNVTWAGFPARHMEHCQTYTLKAHIPYPVIQDGYITSGIGNMPCKLMAILLGTV